MNSNYFASKSFFSDDFCEFLDVKKFDSFMF